jgi:MotA/TolQ/ExbB proton channel family
MKALLLRAGSTTRRDMPLPARDDAIAARTQRLVWAWAAMAGVALFTAWWLRQRGAWGALIDGDPSGISLGITVLSVAVTLWCGARARTLAREALPDGAWRAAWQRESKAGTETALQGLAERSHGPHETAWWFAAAAIKLGLLGTVVGFIVMATQISRMPSFEFDQIQVLLQRMTQGMAIALYTTLVGLLANLWLGAQLLLLDRTADALAADILAGTE